MHGARALIINYKALYDVLLFGAQRVRVPILGDHGICTDYESAGSLSDKSTMHGRILSRLARLLENSTHMFIRFILDHSRICVEKDQDKDMTFITVSQLGNATESTVQKVHRVFYTFFEKEDCEIGTALQFVKHWL